MRWRKHPVNILNNSETNQTSSTLLEHFEELRRRLINILISFLITLPLVYISSKWWITTFVYHIKRTQVVLHTFSFTEMIQIYILIISFVTLCLVLPIIFYQLWAFISPGLHRRERFFIYKYSLLCTALFIIGVGFAYTIGFPLIIKFSLTLSKTMYIQPMIGFNAYLHELIRWLFIFGVVFQLPIFCMGLVKMDVIDIKQLHQYRKYIYFTCFIIASILAPPDITLNLFLTLPLIILFEISILLTKITTRH